MTESLHPRHIWAIAGGCTTPHDPPMVAESLIEAYLDGLDCTKTAPWFWNTMFAICWSSADGAIFAILNSMSLDLPYLLTTTGSK